MRTFIKLVDRLCGKWSTPTKYAPTDRLKLSNLPSGSITLVFGMCDRERRWIKVKKNRGHIQVPCFNKVGAPFSILICANCEFAHSQAFTWVQQFTCIRGLEDTHTPDFVIDTRLATYVKGQPLHSIANLQNIKTRCNNKQAIHLGHVLDPALRIHHVYELSANVYHFLGGGRWQCSGETSVALQAMTLPLSKPLRPANFSKPSLPSWNIAALSTPII